MDWQSIVQGKYVGLISFWSDVDPNFRYWVIRLIGLYDVDGEPMSPTPKCSKDLVSQPYDFVAYLYLDTLHAWTTSPDGGNLWRPKANSQLQKTSGLPHLATSGWKISSKMPTLYRCGDVRSLGVTERHNIPLGLPDDDDDDDENEFPSLKKAITWRMSTLPNNY